MPIATTNRRLNLHPDVIKLGLVSFLTDLSSEMVFSVFAIFFTTIAGGSTALLGLIEGLADFSASSLNYLAGWLSDRSGKRKIFKLAGYAFSTRAKTILLVSTSITGLGAFRVVERLGKGFRRPPRDAWLTFSADPAKRGLSFGVHKALDKAGAVVRPLVAYGLLSSIGEISAGSRTLFWVAFFLAVLTLIVFTFVKDRPGARHERESIDRNWRRVRQQPMGCHAAVRGLRAVLCDRRVAKQGFHCRHRTGAPRHGHRRLQLRDRCTLSASLFGGRSALADRTPSRIRVGRGIGAGSHRSVRCVSARGADPVDDCFKTCPLKRGLNLRRLNKGDRAARADETTRPTASRA